MVFDRNDTFAFKDEKDADDAQSAIENLEFKMPKEWRDPDDPYAFSFSRQRIIPL
jgi:hypothetical protein